MKNVLSVFLLLFFSISSNAEPFTILAKSGLNVRKEGKMNSERVATLPFGTVVEAKLQYDSRIRYKCCYSHFSETIEGKRGFWMKITYGEIEGYIFSGFGLRGKWVVKSTDINNEYRILHTGPTCRPINYDPKLKWYALIKSGGKLVVKKSEVNLRLIHEFNGQDTLNDISGYWMEYPLVVETNLKDTVVFLFGSETYMEQGEILSKFNADIWSISNDRKFIYPEQTYSFNFEGRAYQFRAFEEVILTNKDPKGYIRKYQIELNYGSGHTNIQNYNLSKELELEATAQRHAMYATPLLVFVGDINSDGMPDFVFCSTMSEGCGICWEYHLFLSDITNPNRPFKKVANSISCNCIT
jgi:hypothetical protein